VLAGLLVLGAAVLYATNYKEVREINIFAVVLLVQSLPFVAALALALVERTPFNDFAYWRALETRLGELVTRRSAPAPSPAPAKQPELVQ
jgi:hypothetical protein